MTIEQDTIRARWNEVSAEHARAAAVLQAVQAGNDDDHPTEEAEAWTAWLALMAARAPDAAAIALKLSHLVGFAVERETDGSIDNIADVQWLLDDARCTDSSGYLVSLWQDVLHLAGIDHPVLSIQRLVDRPWPDMVAAYKAAHATYVAAHDGPDDIDDGTAEEAERLIKPVYAALLAYPVWNVEQLAEKAALIAADCRDGDQAFKILAEDAARIAKL